MTDQATPEQTETNPAVIPVDDVNTFAQAVLHWHQGRMAMLRHLAQVPEGASFQVGDKPVVLEGDKRDAFKLGVELCIMQLAELPFQVELEPDTEPVAEATHEAAGG